MLLLEALGQGEERGLCLPVSIGDLKYHLCTILPVCGIGIYQVIILYTARTTTASGGGRRGESVFSEVLYQTLLLLFSE